MSSKYSIDSMKELADALEKAKYSDEALERLQKSDLKRYLDVLYDVAEIKNIRHVIDCDAIPFVEETSKIEKHRRGGQWEFNPCQVSLYSSKETSDAEIFEDFNNKPALNANVYDYLLKHPDIIPASWIRNCVCFWGTIFSCENRETRYVRALYHTRGEWVGSYFTLNSSSGVNIAILSQFLI